MPGESGVTVVTMLVCFVFYRIRGCGRSERPAFPAPSDFRGREFKAKLGRNARRDREAAFENAATSLRGAKRRSNPKSFYPRDGLLRGACHRARIRATRWLAMTLLLAV
jgi:hypothetical protein